MSSCKVAILIDGGFYVQRFKQLNNKMPTRHDVKKLISDIMTQLKTKAAGCVNDTLLRAFYYDCEPFSKTLKTLTGVHIDYSKSTVHKNQTSYLNSLKTIDQFALRLGQLSFAGWKLHPFKSNAANPIPDFRQKGVDMKIGLDMAWMAGRKTVDKIVLVTGDSDFISPIKLVRREGILVYLYRMGSTTLKMELVQHADIVF